MTQCVTGLAPWKYRVQQEERVGESCDERIQPGSPYPLPAPLEALAVSAQTQHLIWESKLQSYSHESAALTIGPLHLHIPLLEQPNAKSHSTYEQIFINQHFLIFTQICFLLTSSFLLCLFDISNTKTAQLL